MGLSRDDPIWHPTTFTKNRERLLNDDVMGRFLEKLMGAPEVKPLLSNEHFSGDGTPGLIRSGLIEGFGLSLPSFCEAPMTTLQRVLFKTHRRGLLARALCLNF